MKIKSLIAATIITLGLGVPSRAQVANEDSLVLASRYDLDSASLIYCATTGINGTSSDRNREPPQGAARVASAASSTTVTSTGTLGSFTNVAVGDILFINVRGVTQYRTVTARASANSITIGTLLSTVAVTDATFSYRRLACGTADTSGAFPVTGVHALTVQVVLAQEVSTSTDYQIECRLLGPNTAWSIVNGPNNDTSTFNDIFATDLPFDECRVGLKVNTDDGDDLTTNAEQFTVIAKRVR